MAKALDVNDLEKQYNGFTLKASFSIEEGETLAFVGPNGSGKTTIIFSILNIVRRDGGHVRFFEQELDLHEVRIKRQLGVFLEQPHLFRDLRVKHILDLCGAFYPAWDEQYAIKLLDEFEIDRNKKFKQLSKGMKNKVALAVAFAPRPRLLILDEPTSGLDPKIRRLFVEKVKQARQMFSPAILLTSHIMRDIEDLADRIAFMEGSRIKPIESKEALKSWRVIEGFCDGSLPLEALALRLDRRSGERVRFEMLTDRYGEDIAEQLRQCNAEITSVSAPDLERIYDQVISSSK